MTIQTNGRYRRNRKPSAFAGGWREVEPGSLFKVIVSSEETHGAYSIVESIAQPGVGSIVHAHHREAEHFLVLEGTAHVVLDGEAMNLEPGQSVSLPRGVPHIWVNRSDQPLRLLAFFTPGGFEKALEMAASETSAMGGIDNSRIGARYGLEALGPKLEVAHH
jgi:mannose-6-phosphate isomerase-like protein (cupin superfamily)